MMARRASHEGSIRLRRDGRWEARIEIGGTRVSRYGSTRADVVTKLRTLQSVPALVTADATLSLQEWTTRWLHEKELRPSTRVTYERVLAHPLAHLGVVRLTRLTAANLSTTFALLREQGRGARRLQLAHGYLKSCLARAVEVGHLATNPLDRVPRPRWSTPTKRYWTLDEVSRFLQVTRASPLRYAPLFALLLTTGLRVSEALALELVEEGRVVVAGGQVWDRSTGYVESEVKTPKARRVLSVPEAGEWALAAIPFRTQSGQIPRPPILYATLAALCAEAKVPPITPHALRHQHAALTYYATGDMYAVQSRLGHAQVTTTMGMYGFGMREDTTTREALDTVLRASEPHRHQPDRGAP